MNIERLNLDDQTCTPETLKGCLDYLYRQAMMAGLKLPAHFIGAASEATSDIIARHSDHGGDRTPHHRPRAVGDW